MLGKLSIRNMKRSAKDYQVYILTMTLVAALMYAFGSLIFQNDLSEDFTLSGSVDLMSVMIGLATFFVVLIVKWLIHYMVRFMLEKRSTEFGIYLLLGMKKKAVARLYILENLLLGGISLLLGTVFGILLQQLLMTVMYSIIRLEYRLHITLDGHTFLVTALCYAACYLLALFRCLRRFKKMNIHDLMNAQRQNEKINEKHETFKQIFFPLSILFILAFWAMFGRLSNTGEIAFFLIGLVVTIYLFYLGLSAWIICYIRKGGKLIYRGQNLFLLRQFASKVRTMQFTMGTLTSLFTLALMGASIALMFSEYENTVLESNFPFDVQAFSSDPYDDFADETAIIDASSDVVKYYPYRIYTDGSNQVNTWMLTHLKAWGTMYLDAAGAPKQEEIEEMLRRDGGYYTYDTYMGITDYNCLREMLGYAGITLTDQEYLVQIKPRLENEIAEIGNDLKIMNAAGDSLLSCAGICADPFSQNGHNGADYLIIVPDEVLGRMHPYYSELAADIDGDTPAGIQQKLDALLPEEEYSLDEEPEVDLCAGSDMILSFGEIYLVRDNLIPEIKYTLASLIIPFFYIGLVFVCVAVTVLSVQQLSDSAKYKYRYDILTKLGISRAATDRLILKQLAAYYLCPAILAILISGKMILFVIGSFVEMTGVPTFGGAFFAKSILLFLGIYLIYFAVTYISFKRNVENCIAK